MSNPFGDLFQDHPGLLNGMKGTRPMTAISEDFKLRLSAIDPHLPDFNYAGEAFDAVVISALATQVAGSTEPRAIAAQIVGVTNGPDLCGTIAGCLARARSGLDVAYRGITVRSGFTAAGEPSTTSYATLHFGPDSRLDPGKTEFLRAGDEAGASRDRAPAPVGAPSTGPLVFGALMTAPGPHSVTSAARIAGARLAVMEINAAHGVLGQPVQWLEGSDGADAGVARAQILAHRAAGAHVLIGTSGSAVGAAVLPQVIGSGMVMFSPSATAASLSTIQDGGLYFRTAPSDALQARALANMIMRDAAKRVTLIGKNDAYGRGLVEDVHRELGRLGLAAESIQALFYDVENGKIRDAAQLGAIASQAVAHRPDGVLVVGTTESAEMIKALAVGQLKIRH